MKPKPPARFHSEYPSEGAMSVAKVAPEGVIARPSPWNTLNQRLSRECSIRANWTTCRAKVSNWKLAAVSVQLP